jgi:predicted dehydrogenase
MKNNQPILLIGSGYMGVEFAKVLRALKQEFIVVGRGEESANNFEKEIGVKVFRGGIEKYLAKNLNVPKSAIVAVSEDQIGLTSIKLIKAGTKEILAEKPGGADFQEIKKVAKTAEEKGTNVYLGYNRRFYASVEEASKIIKKDGGVLSLYFDFTEAVHKIVPLVRAPGVKENWFLHNSTHVIDMAFYLAGIPVKINCEVSGSLSWHPAGAIFTGSGLLENRVPFSYHANWKSAGRWAVEIHTAKHKLIFKPLEKLQIQDVGSFEIKDYSIDDKLDLDYKPGIYKEVTAFLGNKKNLCTIKEQVSNLKFYKKILEG